MSVHVNDLGDVLPYAQPYLNGQPVQRCVELDEFEGWADVYHAPYRLVDGDCLAIDRLRGDVQLHIVPPSR